jgi:DNA mismatch endonuclease, patch repair protein
MAGSFKFDTTASRSRLMKKIRSKNTGPELLLRKALWAKGYRYRLHAKDIPGNPDVVFRKHKLAIFVDGEFWHGYKWEEKKQKIKANREYWVKKIERTIERDQINTMQLQKKGYSVLRFWEHQIKAGLSDCILEVEKYLNTRKSNSN